MLVVDDSPFFRHRIVNMLNASPELEVIGSASNGLDAVRQCRVLQPDVVTMDVEMPVMDGITAVRTIMQQRPTRILMFSSLTEEGAVATLDALEAGALDFLPKRSLTLERGQLGRPVADNTLVQRVIAVGRGALTPPASSNPAPAPAPHPQPVLPLSRGEGYRLVAIGASTGGPLAIRQVLGALPEDFSLPVIVAVHMPAGFTRTFAERLDTQCRIKVKEASDGDELRPGRVLLAPGGKQLLVESYGNGLARARVVEGGGEHIYRPSVDVLLGSAARLYPGAVLGIVMTGMGSDGKQGAELLKSTGSTVWAQDASSCVVYGMPRAVTQAGLSDRELALAEIGPMLGRIPL